MKKFLAVIIILAIVGGGWYFWNNLRGNKTPAPDDIYRFESFNFVDTENKFNLESVPREIFTSSFTLTAANESEYIYANVHTTLPDNCFRYNYFYAVISGENIKEVVFQIGSTTYKTSNVKGSKTTISFKVPDWGLNPRVLVFIDTFATDLSARYSSLPKVLNVHEMGFMV